VSIVLEEKEDFTSFEGVVRKLARVFRELEGSRGLLSNEEKEGNGMREVKRGVSEGKKDGGAVGRAANNFAPHVGGKVYAICEMILEDLNNYCECMTPIGLFHSTLLPSLLALDTSLTPSRTSLQTQQTPST